MHKNTLSLLAYLAVVLLGYSPSLAQPAATDSLAGRIIHVYLPTDDWDSLWVQNWNIPMKKDEKYWYSATLVGSKDQSNQGFFLTTKERRYTLSKSGFTTAEGTRFQVADFQGKQEMWIIVDPAGSISAPPIILLEAPKTVNVLNPWITTAPVMIFGGKTRKMNVTSFTEKCGWFTTMLLDPTMTSGHFAEVNRTDTYGKGGLSSTENFDFTALFATNGPSIWLNTDANVWTPVYPNVEGSCQYLMAATVRDFSEVHPDFEFGAGAGDLVQKGMVQTALGTDRKPKRTTKASANSVSFGAFDQWWITDETNANPKLRAYESCIDIPMSKSSDGLWEYDSYRDSPTDRSFFPIEGAEHNKHGDALPTSCFVKPPPDTTNWTTGGPARNGNFCMESHATFIYQPGQTFSFRGDDDVWVFINDKLVVDLGGVHTPKSDSVKLDNLGLTAGQEYKWDFFYCDRQKCGSSLRVKTSIFFKQQRSLFGKEVPGPTPGSVSLEIWKREGGKGSCASIGETTVDSTKATNLTFQLLDAAGKEVKLLGNGSFYGGGIVIDASLALVTVDTSKIAGGELTPGATYRVVAYEPANAKTKVEVPFKVPIRSFVELVSPLTATAKVGELVMVIAGARESGLPILQAVSYTPNNLDGLQIYLDALGTVPYAAGAALTTDATGFDTLWVTGPATATADKTYSLRNPAPAVNILKLTFTVPKNKVEFEPLVPAPAYARDVPVGTLVTLSTANRENGTLIEKAEPYTLKIPPGLQVFADAAKTVPVVNGVPIATDATGLDMLYATADSTDPVTKTYVLEIVGSTKTMTLTFTMPPLDLPKAVSAAMHDGDGDGIGDSLVVGYDRDISAGPPKQIGYRWPATAAPVMAPGADVPAMITGGTTLVYKTKFSPAVLTGVVGEFLSVYAARKLDSTQRIPIADRIGPIITKAEIFLGVTQDTLRITFSEPINTAGITVTQPELFGYKRMKDGAVETIAPASLTWSFDRKEASLVFTTTAPDAPRAGNLVRINDGAGRIADASGNTAGSQSRFRLIGGGMRSDIKAETYHEIAPTPTLLAEPQLTKTLQPTNAEIKEVIGRTGRVGHLIKTDLGNYAVKDDFSNVEPAQVALEYQVGYFTNHGVPVAGEKRTISCLDPVFSGDCLANRGYLFVGWNYTARDGAKVATGAYAIRFSYQVKVAGVVKEKGELNQVWGVLRKP